MKNKKLVITILVVGFLLLLSLPMCILDGDATAFVLFLILGICAICSESIEARNQKAERSNKHLKMARFDKLNTERTVKQISKEEDGKKFVISSGNMSELMKFLNCGGASSDDICCPKCKSKNVIVVRKLGIKCNDCDHNFWYYI